MLLRCFTDDALRQPVFNYEEGVDWCYHKYIGLHTIPDKFISVTFTLLITGESFAYVGDEAKVSTAFR